MPGKAGLRKNAKKALKRLQIAVSGNSVGVTTSSSHHPSPAVHQGVGQGVEEQVSESRGGAGSGGEKGSLEEQLQGLVPSGTVHLLQWHSLRCVGSCFVVFSIL